MEEILRLEHLEKTFGTHQVLRDISFSVNKGDVISIIGSSGSGKSTMLRCVNLLEEPTGGKRAEFVAVPRACGHGVPAV